MPDKRHHRGPHPQDVRLFAAKTLDVLRTATAELSWLLGRGYSSTSALKLVGDRHSLRLRQRQAIMRCAAPDDAVARRRAHEVASVRGEVLLLDGYNVLTIVESALGGAVVIRGRDRCLRDLGGVHGTFRRVIETEPALHLIGERLSIHGVARSHWFLDRPVSNSGRLKALIEKTAADHGWPWAVDLVNNPDRILATAPEIVATGDSFILDRCERWFAVGADAIAAGVPRAWLVDLGS